jgi:hypothetical protein
LAAVAPGGSELDERWRAFTDQIAALQDVIADAPDEVARVDGYRYLLRFLAAGIRVCTELDDTDNPDLGRSIEHHMSWGLDNPDCLYGYTRVRGDARYRITGNRGSARHLEFQVNTGHQGDGNVAGWKAVSALSGDDLVSASDGSFELLLDPEPQDANWLGLDERASFLLTRQYFSDWEQEESAVFIIERLGDDVFPPPPSAEARLTAELDLLGQWLTTGARCWDDLSRGLASAPPGDIQPFLPSAEASGLKGQAYGMGSWWCGPDEVVIVELDPPACRMWGISLCDRWWQSIDFANRQSSINDSQATLDDDARFVGVIAHDDPGVANWLDTGGHTAGTLALRYLFPDPPEHLPPLRQRTVPRDELGAAQPATIATVSPAERSARLAARHRAVARRYRTP